MRVKLTIYRRLLLRLRKAELYFTAPRLRRVELTQARGKKNAIGGTCRLHHQDKKIRD
jgi:hypothetical protein